MYGENFIKMINYLIYYLFIGTIVGLFIDVIVKFSNNKFTNSQRLINLILWPFILIMFIYYLIKYMVYND